MMPAEQKRDQEHPHDYKKILLYLPQERSHVQASRRAYCDIGPIKNVIEFLRK